MYHVPINSLYVCSSCVQAVRIEHNYNQTNRHHNTLWLRANNTGDQEAAMFNEMIQRYNMGDPQASAMLQQYAQAAGTGAQGYMFGGLI